MLHAPVPPIDTVLNLDILLNLVHRTLLQVL
eukprot:SAG31_NODE_10047_length_1191_cov_1.349817_1_plen_30_part_10